MAARKLQSEIDRTLKKVTEGVEAFESIYDKMASSTSLQQKERQEQDLKTQIKKLQRLRDQIKTWVASNEIKDKTQLVENRKLIETQMEKFKACEKEMKTKAFSKEGLIAALRLDPKEQAKAETTRWLSDSVEELSRQVEQAEAEIETLQGGAKKKQKTAGTKSEELEALNERRKWHISRLEIILRLLENGTLSTDKVLALKEDISYFVESNTEEDFEEDEGIYDELNLDEEEEAFGLHPDDGPSDPDSYSVNDDPPTRTSLRGGGGGSASNHADDSSKRDEHSPVLKKQTIIPLRKPTMDKPEIPKPSVPPVPNFAAQPMSSAVKAGLPSSQAPRPAAPPLRYATAAAAAVSSNPPAPHAHAPPPASQPAPVPANSSEPATPASPSLTHPSVSAASPIVSNTGRATPPPGSIAGSQVSRGGSPVSSLAALSISEAAGQPGGASPERRTTSQSASVVLSPEQPHNVTTNVTISSTTEPAPANTQTNGAVQPPQQPASSLPPIHKDASGPVAIQPSPLPQQVQQVHPSGPSNGFSPTPPYPPGMLHIGPKEEQRPGSATQSSQLGGSTARAPSADPQGRSVPSAIADLVASFESAKQKAPHRMNSLDQVHKVLQVGSRTRPTPQDTEKPKYYIPRNPYTTPLYYPQQPHPVISQPALYSHLDVETLFWVFYFLPGTYQQYLAAKELKKQSWRFHVKYLTWFQRHSEPQAITDEYEQGVYVYFDWEGSWCQRKKSDFRFEYRYLSED